MVDIKLDLTADEFEARLVEKEIDFIRIDDDFLIFTEDGPPHSVLAGERRE